MAQRKYTIDLGQHQPQVVITTGSGMAASVELSIDDTKLTKKEDVIVLLTEVINRMQQEPWPPVNS